jgi:hypothetical protein
MVLASLPLFLILFIYLFDYYLRAKEEKKT